MERYLTAVSRATAANTQLRSSVSGALTSAFRDSSQIANRAGQEIGRSLSQGFQQASSQLSPAFRQSSSQLRSDFARLGQELTQNLAPAFSTAAREIGQSFVSAGRTIRTQFTDIFANLNFGGGGRFARLFSGITEGLSSFGREARSTVRAIVGALGNEFGEVRSLATQQLSRAFTGLARATEPARTEIRALGREYRESLGEVASDVRNIAGRITAPFREIGNALGNEFREVRSLATQQLTGAFNNLARATQPARTEIRALAREYRQSLEEVGAEIRTFSNRVATGARNFATPYVTAIRQASTEIAARSRTIFDSLIATAQQASSRVAGAARTLVAPFVNASQQIGTALRNAFSTIGGPLGSVGGSLAGAIGNQISALSGPIAQASRALATAFAQAAATAATAVGQIGVRLATGVAQAARQAAQSLITSFASAVQSAGQSIARLSVQLGQNLVTGIQSAAPALSTVFTSILAPLGPLFRIAGQQAGQAFQAGMRNLPEALSEVASRIPAALNLAAKGIRFDAKILGLGGGFLTEVGAVTGGLVSSFRNAVTTVRDMFTGLAREIGTGIFRQVGYNIANSIINSVTGAVSTVRDQIQQTLSDAFKFQVNAADISALQLGARGTLPIEEINLQVEDTRQLLRELAIDPQLIVDLDQATLAAAALAKAGVQLGEGREGGGGALLEAIRLQNVVGQGDVDFRRSGEIVGRSAQQYGLFGDELSRITQTLSASLLLSPIKDLNDLGYGFANAGQSAREFDLSIEEVGAALITTATAYKSQREAGTGLNTFLRTIAAATEDQRAAQDKLGLSLFDSQGNFVGLAEAQKQLVDGLSDLSQQERLKILYEAFGVTASKYASALAHVNEETGENVEVTDDQGVALGYIFEIMEKISNVDTQQTIEIRTGTAARRLENLLGILEAARQDLALPLADLFVAPLARISDIIQDAVSANEFARIGQSIAAAFSPAFTTMDRFLSRIEEAQAAGNTLAQSIRIAFADLEASVAATFAVDLGPLQGALMLVHEIFRAFNEATLGPLGELLGLGEQETAGGLQRVSNAQFNVQNRLTGAGGIFQQQLPGVQTEIGLTLDNQISGILDGLGKSFGLFADGLIAIREAISGAAEGEGSPIVAFFNTIGETIRGIGQGFDQADGATIGQGITDIFVSLRDLYSTVIDIGTANIGGVTRDISSTFISILDFLTDVSDNIDGQAVAETLLSVRTSILNFATEVVNNIDAAGIASAAGKLIESLTGAIEEAFSPTNVDEATTAATRLLTAVTTKISEIFASEEFASGVGAAMGNLSTAVLNGLRAIFDYETYRGVSFADQEAFKQALGLSAFEGEVPSLAEAIQLFSQNFREGLSGELIEGGILTAEQLATIDTEVAKVKDTIATKFRALFTIDLEGVEGNRALAGITQLVGNFGDLLEQSRDLGTGPVALVVSGITTFIDTVGNAIREFTAVGGGAESSAAQQVTALVEEILNVVLVFQQLTTADLGNLVGSVSGFVQNILGALTNIANGDLAATEGGPASQIAGQISGIVQELIRRFGVVVEAADLSGITGSFGILLSSIVRRITDTIAGRATEGGEEGAGGGIAGAFVETLGRIGTEIREALTDPDFLGGLVDVGKGIVSLIIGGLSLAVAASDFSDAESGTGSAASGFVRNLLRGIGTTLSNAFSSDTATALGQSAIDLSTNILTAVANAISQVDVGIAAEAAGAFLKRITAGFATLFSGESGTTEIAADPAQFDTTALSQAANALLTGILDQMAAVLSNEQFAQDVGASAANIGIGIANAVARIFEGVGDFFKGATDQAEADSDNSLVRLGAAFSDFGRNFITGISNQLVDADYTAIGQAILDGILNAIQGLTGARDASVVGVATGQITADKAAEEAALAAAQSLQNLAQVERETAALLEKNAITQEEANRRNIAAAAEAYTAISTRGSTGLLAALVDAPAAIQADVEQTVQESEGASAALRSVIGGFFSDLSSLFTDPLSLFTPSTARGSAEFDSNLEGYAQALKVREEALLAQTQVSDEGTTSALEMFNTAVANAAATIGQTIQGPEEEGGFLSSFGEGGDLTESTAALTEAQAIAAEQTALNSAAETEAQALAQAATLATSEAMGQAAPNTLSAATAMLSILGPVGLVVQALSAAATAIYEVVNRIRAAAAAAAAAVSAANAAAARAGSTTPRTATGTPPAIVPGRASAGGGVGVQGRTLVGEEGPELFYSAARGTAGIVGMNGPEVVNFGSPSTVLPADQTASILRRGVRSAQTGAGDFFGALANAVRDGLRGVGTSIERGFERAATQGFASPQQQAAQAQRSGVGALATRGDFAQVDNAEFLRVTQQNAEASQQASQDQADAQTRAAAAAEATAKAVQDSASAVQKAVLTIDDILKRTEVTAEDVEATAAGEYKDKVDEFVRRLAAAANDGSFPETLERAAEALEAAGFEPEQDPQKLYEQFTKAWDDRTLFYVKENLDLINTAAVAEAGAAATAAKEAEALLEEKAKVGAENVAAFLSQFVDGQVQAVAAGLGFGGGEEGGGFGGEGGAGESASAGGSQIQEGINSVLNALSVLGEPLSSLASIVSDSVNGAMTSLAENTGATLEPLTGLAQKAGEVRSKVDALGDTITSAIEEIRKLLRGTGGTETPTDPTPTATSSQIGGSVQGSTLVGEDGMEIWYNAAQRKAGIVGRNGAEFVMFAPGTRVVDADTTASILRRSTNSAPRPLFPSLQFGNVFQSIPAGTGVFDGLFQDLPGNFFGSGRSPAQALSSARSNGNFRNIAAAAARRGAAAGRFRSGGGDAPEDVINTADLLTGSNPIADNFTARLRGRVSQQATRIVVNNNVQVDNSIRNSNNVDYGGLNVQSIRSSESVETDFNTLRLLYG